MNIHHLRLGWKVVAGTAIAVLAAVLVVSRLSWAAAPLLFILICPLMMILMMQGMGTMGADRNAPSAMQEDVVARPEGTHEERLTALKARHEALAREIARLEDDGSGTQEPALVAPSVRPLPLKRTELAD